MQKHPFITYIPYQIAGIVLTAILWILLSWLLILYSGIGWQDALSDSLSTVGILAVSGFLLGYLTGILHAIQIQVALAILVQAICLSGSFFCESLTGGMTGKDFLISIPLRLLFGFSCWIILLQWYRINQTDFREKEEEQEAIAEEVQNAAGFPVSDEGEVLERISVKDGSRIHLIHLEELIYIQACGDYVTLFTLTGQYIKEQTMKYYETHLPPASFIRIHRSCIVNAEQIARVELFGKENYQVRLKNGINLKASISGYRLLKERLSL